MRGDGELPHTSLAAFKRSQRLVCCQWCGKRFEPADGGAVCSRVCRAEMNRALRNQTRFNAHEAGRVRKSRNSRRWVMHLDGGGGRTLCGLQWEVRLTDAKGDAYVGCRQWVKEAWRRDALLKLAKPCRTCVARRIEQ